MPNCTNPVEQIDQERVITIDFPDATFTLEKLELEAGTLMACYSFEDTTGRPLKPYQNSYKLSVFNISGKVNDVKFKRVGNHIKGHNNPST